MKSEFLTVLGKEFSSDEVRQIVRAYALTESEEDPPFRKYLGSKARGLDLLFENDRLIAIQIFVTPTQGFSRFKGELPFGIGSEMNQQKVQNLLGRAVDADIFNSRYQFPDIGVGLAVNFGKHSEITYLNISLLK